MGRFGKKNKIVAKGITRRPLPQRRIVKRKAGARRPEFPASRQVKSPVFESPILHQSGDGEREPTRELPRNYGDNQIYLMVRDPYWIYAYWEIQKENQEKTLARLGGNWNDVQSVLRLYDTAKKETAPAFFDISLQGLARNWYIQVEPNRSYVVEIGLLHHDGRFLPLARSNEVTTPRAGMSEVVDEQWMGIDFEKMYALSGGFEVGKSSLELRKLMEERLKGAISSGSGAGVISSLASPVKIKKEK